MSLREYMFDWWVELSLITELENNYNVLIIFCRIL